MSKRIKCKPGYDFAGWATVANTLCSDGRTIMKDAFKDNDGETVPLVWNHDHDSPLNVLGHALLENTDDGVIAYCCQGISPKNLIDGVKEEGIEYIVD